MSKIIRLWDRSRTTTDETCKRRRFWNYEYKRRGIVQATTSLELFTGIVTHDALAAIAKGVAIDDIARAAFQQMYEVLASGTEGIEGAEDYAREQATLTEGMIRGFHKHAWPRIMADYPTILYIEEENEYIKDKDALEAVNGAQNGPRSVLQFMAKPDLVAEGPGGIAYIEYKTTSSKRDNWINSWETQVQLHSSIKAVKQSLGVDIDHVIVQGLYKGYESYGKQTSPFCYAYKRSGNPPFTKDQLSYEYVGGWRKYPVWELEGGCKAWVEGMPEHVLADQFPRTPPIFVNEMLVDAFFRQREIRERAIELGVELLEKYEGDDEMTQYVMDSTFPQTFSQCTPGWGQGCPYLKMCFGFVQDPLVEGYQWREAHHAAEANQHKEKDNETDNLGTS